MKITVSRANDILHWLDDEPGNHALLFEKMTLHRDAAALIRQLQAELQDAWHAGIDAGREQGRSKDHAHPSPSVPVGVERKYPDDGNGDDDAYNRGWNDCLDALAQQPAAVDEAMVERAWVAFCEYTGAARQGIRSALTAALAQPPVAPVGVVMEDAQ